MSAKEQSFHPYWAWTVDDDGRGAIGTSQDQPGITQRLWVGTQLLAAILGQVARTELPYLIEHAHDWASAADAFAAALVEQQVMPAGQLSVQLLHECLSITEARRRRRQADAQARGEEAPPAAGGEVQP